MMITHIPLFAVREAAKLARAKAKADRTLNACLRRIDFNDPLFNQVVDLYADAQTYGAFCVYFKAKAIGKPA